MGDRIENCFLEMVAELNHLFVVAAGTKPAPPATECQEELMMAVRAFNAGEALM